MNSLLYVLIIIVFGFCLIAGCTSNEEVPAPDSIPGPSIVDIEEIAASKSGYTLTDADNRKVTIPRNITSVLCSGDGCMRYLSYLQSTEATSWIDRAERDYKRSEQIPYLFTNKALLTYSAIDPPITPAQIQNMQNPPDIILIMNYNGLYSPDDLQMLTGIPVMRLEEGDLTDKREDLDYTLRVMGLILGKSERAEEVIRFFDKLTDNLENRVSTVPEFGHPDAYIGGLCDEKSDSSGSILSTTSNYIPFQLLKIQNSIQISDIPSSVQATGILPEKQIYKLSPDVIFIDLYNFRDKNNTIVELESQPDWHEISAVMEGEIYGLLPSKVIGNSPDIDLINSYMVGKVLYPDKFTDVEPKVMADFILAFFYGKPIFDSINLQYNNQALSRVLLF